MTILFQKYAIEKYKEGYGIIDHKLGSNGLFIRTGSSVDYSKPTGEENDVLLFKSRDEAMAYLKKIVR